MPIEETYLPGVGTKFEIDIEGERQLVIIVHHTGQREIYIRERANADSKKVLELPDELARKVGSILEGAKFQPIYMVSPDTMLSEDSTLEWATVEEESELVGRTLSEAKIGERTGVSILVIQREDTTIPSPKGDTTIEPGDRVVVLGSQESIEEFTALSAT